MARRDRRGLNVEVRQARAKWHGETYMLRRSCDVLVEIQDYVLVKVLVEVHAQVLVEIQNEALVDP